MPDDTGSCPVVEGLAQPLIGAAAHVAATFLPSPGKERRMAASRCSCCPSSGVANSSSRAPILRPGPKQNPMSVVEARQPAPPGSGRCVRSIVPPPCGPRGSSDTRGAAPNPNRSPKNTESGWSNQNLLCCDLDPPCRTSIPVLALRCRARTSYWIFATDHRIRAQVLPWCSIGAGGRWRSRPAAESLLLNTACR